MKPEPEISYGLGWLQEWADKPVMGGKSFKEFFLYKNENAREISLYYLYETLLHWSFFSKNPLLKGVKPVSKILFEIDKNGSSSPGRLSIPNFVLRTYFWTRIYARRITGYARKKTSLKGTNVILGSDQFAKHKDEADTFWGEIISEMKKQKTPREVVYYDRIWTPLTLKSLPSLGDKDCFIGRYYDEQTIRKMRALDKTLRKTWKSIRDNDQFKSSLIYEGKNISDLIIPHFDFVFGAMTPYIAEVVVSAEEIVSEEPSKIIIDNEENYYGKACTLLANGSDIKIIALQYELIYPFCVHRHVKNPELLKRNFFKWRPLPDIKCVSGESAKNTLIDCCNYDPDLIVVTGQPRYDQVPSIKKLDPSLAKTLLKIPKEEHVILYAASDHDYESLTQLITKNPAATIIVKPHPNVHVGVFKKFVHSHPKVCLKESDIISLLPACDAVVTHGSTVAAEAILFGKPVIIVSKDKSPTGIEYIKMGAALHVTPQKKLLEEAYSAKNLLGNKDALAAGRRRFIQRYYANLGSATAEVLKVINK